MGRKPYKKILLREDEYKVVSKMAHWTRVDESWFHLIVRKSGDCQTPLQHCVLDMERKAPISLQFGLKLLWESFGGREEEDLIKEKILSKKELKTWQNLLARIK